MDIKRKNKGTFSIIGTLCFILLCVFIATTVGLNYSIKELDSSKDTYFDTKEKSKEWVVQEIINYLSVVDASTWESYSTSSNLDAVGKIQIYGDSYDTFKLPNVTEYQVIDVQYTMDEDKLYQVYVNTIIVLRGHKRTTTFIATIRDNKISMLEVY